MQNVFYFIKTIRLAKGVKFLNITQLMTYLKERRTEENERRIKEDPTVGEERLIDYNQIERILFISFSLKTFKLFMIIITFSYISASAFKILLEFEEDVLGGTLEYEQNDCENDSAIGYFTNCYGLSDKSVSANAIILVYFSFTSLSTVGFGDYNPKSNLERIVIAFFLLFGVAIFSYIMGIFIDILGQFKDLNAELDQGEELNKFFGVIKKFNMNIELDIEIKQRIEQFFDFKWINDKNFAFQMDEYQNVVEQMPDNLIEDIYFKCLYYQFWARFHSYFELPKGERAGKKPGPDGKETEVKILHARYNIEHDFELRGFVKNIMQKLEPIKFERGEILYEELDEFTEIIIIMRGITETGYRINGVPKFVVKYYGGIIGDYFVTHNLRSQFIYRTNTQCKGYFIRKKAWMDIIEDDDFKILKPPMLEKVRQNFQETRKKILDYKLRDLKKIAARHDYDYILSLTYLNNDLGDAARGATPTPGGWVETPGGANGASVDLGVTDLDQTKEMALKEQIDENKRWFSMFNDLKFPGEHEIQYIPDSSSEGSRRFKADESRSQEQKSSFLEESSRMKLDDSKNQTMHSEANNSQQKEGRMVNGYVLRVLGHFDRAFDQSIAYAANVDKVYNNQIELLEKEKQEMLDEIEQLKKENEKMRKASGKAAFAAPQ